MMRRTVSSCDLLDTAWQQVKLAVPGHHLDRTVVRGLGFRRVSAQGLIERHVEVVAVSPALVIIDERAEHLRVVIGAEDALDDDVEAATERVPRYQVDQSDVRACGHVALAQHLAAQGVLPHDRQVSPAVPTADLRRGRRLARGRVPPQDDQPHLARTSPRHVRKASAPSWGPAPGDAISFVR
jgi:hypothetical protein